MIVITINNIIINVTSFTALYRAKSRVRKKGKRKSRFKIEEHEDPEIQAEINKGNTVNILYDSSY